ncbi:unnamed protein product [Arabidopsis halleri]
MLHIHLTTVTLPDPSHDSDSYVWTIGGDELQSFSTKKYMGLFKTKTDPAKWTEHVWFKDATPRRAFIFWLKHLDRLPTRARLQGWGLQIEASCCLCGLFLETRDHLFLHYEVSADI